MEKFPGTDLELMRLDETHGPNRSLAIQAGLPLRAALSVRSSQSAHGRLKVMFVTQVTVEGVETAAALGNEFRLEMN